MKTGQSRRPSQQWWHINCFWGIIKNCLSYREFYFRKLQQEVFPFEQVQRKGLINQETVEITEGVGTERAKLGSRRNFFLSSFFFFWLNYITACSSPRQIEKADKQKRNHNHPNPKTVLNIQTYFLPDIIPPMNRF